MSAPKTSKPDRSKWPTRAQVARLLNINVSMLRRWVEDGDLEEVFSDGAYRFDPENVERAKALVKAGADLGAATADQGINARLNEQLLTALKDVLKLVVDPAKDLHAAALKENERLAAHNVVLQEKYLASIAQYEKSVSEQHARDIATREHESSERRKDQILERGLAGLELIAQKWGAEKEFSKLVATLTDEQLALFVEAKFITKEQATAIYKIRGGAGPSEKEKETNHATDQGNGRARS